MLPKSISQGFASLVLWYCLLVLLPQSTFPPAPASAIGNQTKSQAKFGTLPLHFEPGQTEGRTRFFARGNGYSLSLDQAEMVLTIGHQGRSRTDTTAWLRSGSRPLARTVARPVRIKLLNANSAAHMSGREELPGKVNFFVGNDARKWRTGIPTYARVRCEDVYPGVALVYCGNQRRLEYDFIVAPGADSAQIALGIEGADEVTLDGEGNLLLSIGSRILKQQRPVIYQEVNGDRSEVHGEYLLAGKLVRFQVGDYDRSRPLVIDPILSLAYSTYLGGTGDDVITDIALDAGGNAYVTGLTESTNFPTRGAAQPGFGGGEIDAFVVKLNPAGTDIVYSTYLGGDMEDQAFGIAVDTSGNAYVTGQTCSRNFPTRNARQASIGGFCDAFVTKLNAAGSALEYSTYLGGRNIDPGMAIAVDAAGSAYVVGWTQSLDFPVRNAFQATLANIGDAFVAKFNAAGSDLVFSTFLGGNHLDFARAIAVDAAGNAYVTGETRSTNFPTVNALQPTKGESLAYGDAFVTKFNPSGSALVYSTYLGGSCDTEGWGIAVDAAGSAYVMGNTCSTNFPTVSAFQPQYGGGEFSRDAFVSKLNPAGTALVYSTYLGGSGSENDENMGAIAVDANGQAYVAGMTCSTNFPVKSALQSTPGGRCDLFITKFTAAGSSVVYSTYLGGSDTDGMYLGGMAVDAAGNAFVAGVTQSKDFPTTAGAFQTSPATDVTGSLNAIIAKLAAVSNASTASVSAASFAPAPVAPESIVAAFGTDLAVATQAATTTPLPTELVGTMVKIRDSAGVDRLAPLFFVSNAQVNYLIPSGTATGDATVSISAFDGFVSTGSLSIAPVAPGLFAANANGKGVVAAIALRVKADGSQLYEPVVQFDAGQQNFVALPIDLGPANEQVYIIVFGTGLRFRSSLMTVTAALGGTNLPVPYAGQQGEFIGLDQINLGPIPRSLAGRGEMNLALTVDGKACNVVSANVR